MNICPAIPIKSVQYRWSQNLLLIFMLVLLSALTTVALAQDHNEHARTAFQIEKQTPTTESNTQDHRLQQSLERRKEFEKQLKEYTRYELTDDSTLSVQRHGIKLETEYRQGDIRTFLETRGDKEVTFTLKISF